MRYLLALFAIILLGAAEPTAPPAATTSAPAVAATTSAPAVAATTSAPAATTSAPLHSVVVRRTVRHGLRALVCTPVRAVQKVRANRAVRVERRRGAVHGAMTCSPH